jgi:hydroxymethylbilane synthase
MERQLLALLGGGCTAPVAAHARPVRANTYRLTARVATPDGKRVLTAEAEEESGDALLGAVWRDLLAQGASDLLTSDTA